MKKVLITNKVTSGNAARFFFITLSKSIACTSFSRPTAFPRLKQPTAVFCYLLFATMLTACASGPTVVVVIPDTEPGDQIQNEHLVGKWCTNREQTAISNQAAGFSGLLNVRPVFWRFDTQGEWDTSTSGFLYENWGSWKIDGLDKLLLAKKGVAPKPYQVQFKNDEDGTNLYLVDDKDQFTVLSHCD